MCPKHPNRPSVEGRSRCRQCIDQSAKWRAKNRAAGLCRCGEVRDPDFVLCLKCREQFRARTKKSREAGLCNCGRIRFSGYLSCKFCLELMANLRAQRAKKGLCHCGKRPPKKDFKQCQECLDQVCAKKAARRAKGLCMCGKLHQPNLIKCSSCLDREARRQADRLRTDEIFRITRRIRLCIGGAFTRRSGAKRTFHTETLLGCKIAHAKVYIEKQFESGMSWANHGKWHIDHYIPCKFFDLTQERQQRLCNNWRNLCPLWKSENREKRDKLPLDYVERLAELEKHVPHFNCINNDPCF